MNNDFSQTFQKIERGLVLTASLLILVAGGLVFRSCRRILSERGEFQGQLQALNDNLENVVELRTAELQSEVAERKRAELLMADQAEFLFNTIEALSHPFMLSMSIIIRLSSPIPQRWIRPMTYRQRAML